MAHVTMGFPAARDRALTARRLTTSLALSALVFATVGPTLTWLNFSNGIENLNVVTALEMRRGGPWLIPTLQGEPRLRKPPLTAWVTALALRPDTVARLSSSEPAERDAARRELTWQARWPGLLAVSLTVGAAYLLGALLLGGRGGVAAALAAASNVLFFRFCRFAATDAHLTLWVTVANVFLVMLVLQRRRWLGATGAGAALGLAFMSKGPVALLLSVVPAVAFVLWDRLRAPRGMRDARAMRSYVMPILAGTLVMLVVGLSWFAYGLSRHPHQLATWWMEVMRTDPTEADRGKWHQYFLILPMMAPWTAVLVAALAFAAVVVLRGGRVNERERLAEWEFRRLAYVLMLLVVPLVIMSLFRDRKVRYLFPLVVPAGLLVAALLPRLWRERDQRVPRLLLAAHWLTLAGIGIGLPVAGALGLGEMRRLDGSPWFSPAVGAAAAVAAAAVLAVCMMMFKSRPGAIVFATVAVMFGVQLGFLHGTRHGEGGRCEMLPLADLIWQRCPDAVAYDITDGRHKRIPPELAIYLNRVTRQAPSIDAIPHDARHSQIYVELQRRGAPIPQPAPGWTYFDRVPRNPTEWWVAFARGPQRLSRRDR